MIAIFFNAKEHRAVDKILIHYLGHWVSGHLPTARLNKDGTEGLMNHMCAHLGRFNCQVLHIHAMQQQSS